MVITFKCDFRPFPIGFDFQSLPTDFSSLQDLFRSVEKNSNSVHIFFSSFGCSTISVKEGEQEGGGKIFRFS